VATIDPIKVAGLAEFNRNLKRLDRELPKALRLAHNEAATIVVDWAQPKVPRKTGAAARSVKAKSTRTESRVVGGSAKVPYYPWLDFGGRVGRQRSVHRAFHSDGRYLYPGLGANRERINDVLLASLLDVARQAGVEVDS